MPYLPYGYFPSRVTQGNELPTADDLIAFLQAAGLIATPPTDAEEQLDFANAVDGALEIFYDAAGRKKILQDTDDVARTFSPPGPNRQARAGGAYVGGGRNLQLDEGLLTFTSLTVEGVTYTEGEQFTLMPGEAGNAGEAYEWIEFHTPVWGRRNSIVVTGKWGIAATLPADLKRALLASAALLILPQIAAAQSGGLQSLKLGQDTWTWNANGAYNKEIALWQALVDRAASKYRLLKV